MRRAKGREKSRLSRPKSSASETHGDNSVNFDIELRLALEYIRQVVQVIDRQEVPREVVPAVTFWSIR
jgi:hypothetical protein